MSEKFGMNVSDSSSSDSTPVVPVPEPELPPAAVPASSARVSAKRTRQSSPAKRSKQRTDEVGETETELSALPQTGYAEKDALSKLPPELLAIIIRKLDFKSISNLNNTCTHLRNIVRTPGVVTKLDLSLSTLDTVQTKLNFFHDISGHVKVLNLSGVYDLDLPALVLALEHMESLVDLDVSYTKIILPDFLQFKKVRPTLKSLVINFCFGVKKYNWQLSKDELSKYQRAFEGFRTVHFVCPVKVQITVYCVGEAAILMLLKADLLRFTLTIMDGEDWDRYQEEKVDCNVTAMSAAQFRMHLLTDTVPDDEEPGGVPLLRYVEVDKCEIIVIIQCMCCSTQVLATPFVKRIICERFAVEVGHLPESTSFRKLDTELESLCRRRSEMFLMFWHRERNQFEGEFCSQLLSIFKEYYVFNVRSDTLTRVPPGFKWHKMTHVISSAPSSLELDYGEAFKEQRDIKLVIQFDDDVDFQFEMVRPKVIKNYDFLKKITFLSLLSYLPVDSDFCNDLFENCESLVTFQIILSTVGPLSLQFVKKSKLKNIYIEGDGFDLCPTFSVLSECRTLERYVYFSRNVRGSVDTLPEPTELFRKCGDLYYICIHAKLNPDNRDEMITIYNKAKSALGRDELTIDIRDIVDHQYTPYMNVFNVFQLKPI